MKRCPACRRALPFSMYYTAGFDRDGRRRYNSRCKPCLLDQLKLYRDRWKLKAATPR